MIDDGFLTWLTAIWQTILVGLLGRDSPRHGVRCEVSTESLTTYYQGPFAELNEMNSQPMEWKPPRSMVVFGRCAASSLRSATIYRLLVPASGRATFFDAPRTSRDSREISRGIHRPSNEQRQRAPTPLAAALKLHNGRETLNMEHLPNSRRPLPAPCRTAIETRCRQCRVQEMVRR